MPLHVIFVSGPRQAGKTTLIAALAQHVLTRPVHYVRLIADDVYEVGLPRPTSRDFPDRLLTASRRDLHYTASHVFEALQDGLREIRELERHATVVVEGDTDASLRHAYPYDNRIFVMPIPARLHDVFRTPAQAARALQQVMQDTAAFASEIFGLFDDEALDLESGHAAVPRLGGVRRSPSRHSIEISERQIRTFLATPLGAEIASRIQLHPPYHGLVESDVILVNAGRGDPGGAAEVCLQRIERLMARIRPTACERGLVYSCDLLDPYDPAHPRLIARLKDLVYGTDR